MVNFFSKLFGLGKADGAKSDEQILLQEALEGVIANGGFDLKFAIETNDEGYSVNFSGGDSDLLTEKEGLLLDSMQFYLKRVLQNRNPQTRTEVAVDCDGYRETSSQELIQLAEKLRDLVLEKGRPAYVRALRPRDRRVIHRHLADDTRIKTQSVGDGFYKKIRIVLAQGSASRKTNREAPQVEV